MDNSSLGWNMSKAVGIICMMLCLSSMAGIMSPVSAQILPEVILECDDELEINPEDSTAGIIDCTCLLYTSPSPRD